MIADVFSFVSSPSHITSIMSSRDMKICTTCTNLVFLTFSPKQDVIL